VAGLATACKTPAGFAVGNSSGFSEKDLMNMTLARRPAGRLPLICCSLVVAMSALPLAGAQTAAAATGVPFLAHQAAYDLSLTTSRRSPSVEGVRGRIVYKFTGSDCEGYTTDFRQVSQIQAGEDKTQLSDLRSTSWEDAGSKTYRFKIKTLMNDAETSAVDGFAERGADGVVVVKLKQPQVKTFTLAKDIVFPNEQVHRIIQAAREGKSLLQLSVYDGSDNGEKIYNTLTVIGQPIAGDRPPASPDAGSDNTALKSMTRWPVTISYYDRSAKQDSGEQTPAYAMSFELYENGVSRKLSLDYNDFVIAGAMSKFDVEDSKPCK
jgi:hypothetical protein